MESISGIGYVVYCPNRGMFLGKLSTWFSDVRLASVYSEPSKARMALNRADTSEPCVVVQARLTVEGKHIDYAVEAVAKANAKEAAAKPQAQTAPAKPGSLPTAGRNK